MAAAIAAVATMTVAASAAPQTPAVAPATAAQIAAARQLGAQDKLAEVLVAENARPATGVIFESADKDGVFRASVTGDLKNTERLEILISATETVILFTVYPKHKNNEYVALSEARDVAGLMRTMLNPPHSSGPFFFTWGVDHDGDIFNTFHIATERGFPVEAVTSMVRNLRAIDGFFGELRPLIDGSQAAP